MSYENVICINSHITNIAFICCKSVDIFIVKIIM